MNRKSREKQHRKEMNSFFLSVCLYSTTDPAWSKEEAHALAVSFGLSGKLFDQN